MASEPYSEFEMRKRESLKAFILAQPELQHLDNQSANVLTERLLAELARAGFTVTKDGNDA